MPFANDPFDGPLPAEVPLPNAPLVRVLCQIRFPEILAIENKEFVAPFQEEIRSNYPVLRQGQASAFLVGPQGLAPAKVETSWKFHDAKDAWRLTLTPSFLTLETGKYQRRKDFLERLRHVTVALGKHVRPGLVDRVGLRYIDQVQGGALEKLSTLVRPEVLGMRSSSLSRSLLHCVQESAFSVGNAQLMARSALLPPNASPDPSVISPVSGPSWVLDLDMFSTEPMEFQTEAVSAKVTGFAERIYAFFRWATTEEFLREYGG